MFGIIPSEKHSRYCGKTVLIYDYSLLRFVMEIACESGVQSVRTTRNKLIKNFSLVILTENSLVLF